MIEAVEGLIIKETPYGESSKIINIITKEHGIIGVMCKGAKSMKSKLRASTMKLTYGMFNIYYKENKLSLLSSVDIINPFVNIKNDILKISYASYLLELTTQVLKQSNDINIYEDLINALIKIDDNLDPLIITNIIEVKYLDYLGVGLNLESCNLCNKKNNIVTLSLERGGLICKDCYNGEELLDLRIIKLLNMYYLIDIKSISTLKIDYKLVDQINRFLSCYYEDYTGLYLKSKDFLKKLTTST